MQLLISKVWCASGSLLCAATCFFGKVAENVGSAQSSGSFSNRITISEASRLGSDVRLVWHLDDSTKRPPAVIVEAPTPEGINSDNEFVSSPTPLPCYLELRTTSGQLVNSKSSYRNARSAFPDEIRSQKLPRIPWAHTLRGLLSFRSGVPTHLGSFNLRDVFPTAGEGDYTLTVWPVVYQFSKDLKTVKRVDLPHVSLKIHLS
jgi:hypothetical protein